MKQIFTLLCLLLTNAILAQKVADFENFSLGQESFLNGEDGSGGFTSGDVFLQNTYDSEFMFWSGWAISNTTDVSSPGFMNQYSSIAGEGANSSSTYAVTFVGAESKLILEGESMGKPVKGLYLNNGTYPYLSMKNGDSFAKKFGGADGSDPDFFVLTIKKYLDGVLSSDSVDFYLADYRFEDANEDYIVDAWTWVDLSSLGNVDSLSFTLNSSDVGQFGMNTPSYFCIDDVETTSVTSLDQISNLEEKQFTVSSIQVDDQIKVDNKNNLKAEGLIYSMQGQLLQTFRIDQQTSYVQTADFAKASYVICIHSDMGIETSIVFIQ